MNFITNTYIIIMQVGVRRCYSVSVYGTWQINNSFHCGGLEITGKSNVQQTHLFCKNLIMSIATTFSAWAYLNSPDGTHDSIDVMDYH